MLKDEKMNDIINIYFEDLFDRDEDTEMIVNPVNCVGVAGKGLALKFRINYPENYQYYKKICSAGGLSLGKVLVYARNSKNNPKYIVNFPTKYHWKDKSSIAYIEAGLLSLTEEISKLNIKSISIPSLGCGLGGLKWEDIRPIIVKNLLVFSEIKINLYAPQ